MEIVYGTNNRRPAMQANIHMHIHMMAEHKLVYALRLLQ